MTIYVDFTSNQSVFYDTNINSNIPTTAKEISQELHESFLNNQSIKTIDPTTLQLIDRPPTPIDPIQTKIQNAINLFNASDPILQSEFYGQFLFLQANLANPNILSIAKTIISNAQPPINATTDQITNFNNIKQELINSLS